MSNEATLNNEALIAEMLRDAKKAEVPSELDRNPVIHKGDADQPAPMMVKEMTNAGYVWIYDTRTGERIPCISYMVRQKLQTRRPDGSFRFNVTDPGFRPKAGTIKCMLHKEAENREHFNELGFRICPKANLTNNYQLSQHMKKKHPQEWAAIDEEKKTKEKEEDRALQRLLLTNQLGKAEKTMETLPDAPKSKSELFCNKCGANFTNKKVLEKHEETCAGK